MKINKKENKIYKYYVLTLLVIISIGLLFVYIDCARYEKNSPDVLIEKTICELEKESGLSLSCNRTPSIKDNGIMSYTVKCKNEDFALIHMKKTGKALIVLACCEITDVESLKEYRIISYGNEYPDFGETARLDAWKEYEWEDVPFLKTISTDVSDFPKLKQSLVHGLYTPEKIKNYNQKVDVISHNDKNFFLLSKAENENEIHQRAKQIIEGYSKYISNDTSFYSISEFFMKDYPLASRLRKLQTQYFATHSSSEITDIQMSHVYMLSDKCVILNAKYNFTVALKNGIISDPTELSMVLCLCPDGKWRLGEMATSLYFDFGEFTSIK